MLSTVPLELVFDDDDDEAPPPSSRSGVELRAVERVVPVSTRRVCDTVRFQTDRGEATVHLVEGRVAWVTSKLGGRSFYARLMEYAGLTAHEIELVFALCRAEKLNFCEMLVHLELVDRMLLRALFREHVAEHVRTILAAPGLRAGWERTRSSFTGELLVPLSDMLDKQELARWREIVAAAGGADDDRRVAERRTTNLIANVEAPRGVVAMMLEDFSRTGALLRAPCQLARGTRVVVRLTVAGTEVALPATVVRFRRGSSLAPPAIGVAWINTSEEIERLIEETFLAL